MRARILLLYAQGRSIAAIQKALGISRPTIYKCIDRAIAGGALAGLEDHVPTAHSAPLSDDARKWFVGLACISPRQLGMDRGHWTFSGLVAHVQEHATGAGYPELVRASRSTRTLASAIANYLQRREQGRAMARGDRFILLVSRIF